MQDHNLNVHNTSHGRNGWELDRERIASGSVFLASGPNVWMRPFCALATVNLDRSEVELATVAALAFSVPPVVRSKWMNR